MGDRLRLRVVTPERLLVDEEVDEMIAPGALGEFGVLPDHITFLGALETGRLVFKKGGSARPLAVSGGFAEVVENVVTVLADAAEFAEEIDAERAEAALSRAQERLEELSPYSAEYEAVEAAVRRARNRLSLARP